PVPALANQVTTLALGEESSKAGDPGQVITLAKGEEALKG
ncbi:MAG: hypothetical protein QG656_567, partial [Candidatus Hydrogenedentes bacterium]|nr:hypothetical protein [Candidatus Hydrogenedentota bacterium]